MLRACLVGGPGAIAASAANCARTRPESSDARQTWTGTAALDAMLCRSRSLLRWQDARKPPLRSPSPAATTPQAHAEAQLCRPEAALLVPQSPPDCVFRRGDLKTADPDLWAKMKIEYERQCYQAAERRVREQSRPAAGRQPLRDRGGQSLTPAPTARQSGGEMVNVHNSVIFLPPSTATVHSDQRTVLHNEFSAGNSVEMSFVE